MDDGRVPAGGVELPRGGTVVVNWKVVEEQGRVRGPWERKVVGWNSTVQGVEEVQQEGSAMETRAGDVRVRT